MYILYYIILYYIIKIINNNNNNIIIFIENCKMELIKEGIFEVCLKYINSENV